MFSDKKLKDTLQEEYYHIYSKQVKLHKPIAIENILCVPIAYTCKAYIFDKTDLAELPDADRFHYNPWTIATRYGEVPFTLYDDPLVYFNTYSTQKTFLYPYGTERPFSELATDPVYKITYNSLRKSAVAYSDFAFIVRLDRLSDTHVIMKYYLKEKNIKKIIEGKRDIYSALFHNIIYASLKKQIEETIVERCSLLLQPNPNLSNLPKLTWPDSHFGLRKDIRLFNYQKGDIQWMLDLTEKVDSGTNVLEHTYPNAVEHTLGSGHVFVRSDLTLHESSELKCFPKCTNKTIKYYGGNLISEVGLGKTLVTLCYAIAISQRQRIRYNNFVVFTQGCQYLYKRGKKGGKRCESELANPTSTIFCKEHKKTSFLEKRTIHYKNLQEFVIGDFTTTEITKTTTSRRFVSNATLILCPSHLADQWVKEYYDKFENDHRIVLILTKDQYTNVTNGDLLFADFVIVSYQFLLNNFYQCRKNSKKVEIPNLETVDDKVAFLNASTHTIFNLFRWKSIVLDEAHEIGNMPNKTLLKKTIAGIPSNYRWNVTGTPFANGLSSFLHLTSYNTSYVGVANERHPYQSHYILGDYIDQGINPDLVNVVAPLYRRNTKESVSMELEQNTKNDHLHLLTFTEIERNIYNSYLEGHKNKYADFLIRLCCHAELHNETKELIRNCKTFEEIQSAMLDYTTQQMNNLNSQITDTKRQIEQTEREIKELELEKENGVGLNNNWTIDNLKTRVGGLKRSLKVQTTKYENTNRTVVYLNKSIQTLNNNNIDEECPICLDTLEDVSITKCGHKFCWECIRENFKIKLANSKVAKCPTCNTEINLNEIYSLDTQKTDSDTNELVSLVKAIRSTKIGNIIYFLKNNLNGGDKVILFSQWDELLHKVGDQLEKYGLKIVYCKGTVYQKKRAIGSFCKDPDVNIIMLSSKNAASGINLIAANRIILLEPVYGNSDYRESIEAQAVGRADRIGQERDIQVHRFIIKDTIEEEIINNQIDVKPKAN